MNWFFLTIISAVFFSLTAVLQRVIMKDKQSDPYAYAVAFQLAVAGVMFLYVVVFSQFTLPSLYSYIPNLLMLTIFYATANMFLFNAFKNLDAAEVAILRATFSIWVLLGSVLFLHEAVSSSQLIGVFLVVSGVGVISHKGSRWKLNKGIVYGLLSAVFFGLAFVNDAYMLQNFHVPSYLVIAFLFPAAFMMVVRPRTGKTIVYSFRNRRIFNLVLISIFYAIAAVSIYLAYQAGGNASQIAPIGQSSIVLTMIFSYIILNERSYIIYKTAGSLLVAVGVLLLY